MKPIADSSHDFGKNIIPNMLAEGLKLIAYRFCGYWKDVGTIASLWEANMDILDRPEEINFSDRSWRIYSRNPVKPAHYIAAGARVINSALTDGCNIYGTVEHSVLSNSVTVEKGAVVRDSILMPGVTVQAALSSTSASSASKRSSAGMSGPVPASNGDMQVPEPPGSAPTASPCSNAA